MIRKCGERMKIYKSFETTINEINEKLLPKIKESFPDDKIILIGYNHMVPSLHIGFGETYQIYDLNREDESIRCNIEKYNKILLPIARELGFKKYFESW